MCTKSFFFFLKKKFFLYTLREKNLAITFCGFHSLFVEVSKVNIFPWKSCHEWSKTTTLVGGRFDLRYLSIDQVKRIPTGFSSNGQPASHITKTFFPFTPHCDAMQLEYKTFWEETSYNHGEASLLSVVQDHVNLTLEILTSLIFWTFGEFCTHISADNCLAPIKMTSTC